MRYRKDSFIRWYFKERSLSSIDSIRPTTQSLRDKAVEFGYEFRELSVNGVKEHRIRWSQSGDWFTIPDFITNHRSMIAKRAQSEISRLDGLYPGAESEKKPKLLVEFQSGSSEAYAKATSEVRRLREQLEQLRSYSDGQSEKLYRIEDLFEEIAEKGTTGPIGELLQERGLMDKFLANRKQRRRVNS